MRWTTFAEYTGSLCNRAETYCWWVLGVVAARAWPSWLHLLQIWRLVQPQRTEGSMSRSFDIGRGTQNRFFQFLEPKLTVLTRWMPFSYQHGYFFEDPILACKHDGVFSEFVFKEPELTVLWFWNHSKEPRISGSFKESELVVYVGWVFQWSSMRQFQSHSGLYKNYRTWQNGWNLCKTSLKIYWFFLK